MNEKYTHVSTFCEFMISILNRMNDNLKLNKFFSLLSSTVIVWKFRMAMGKEVNYSTLLKWERVTTTNFTTSKFKKNIEKIVTNHYIESLH